MQDPHIEIKEASDWATAYEEDGRRAEALQIYSKEVLIKSLFTGAEHVKGLVKLTKALYVMVADVKPRDPFSWLNKPLAGIQDYAKGVWELGTGMFHPYEEVLGKPLGSAQEPATDKDVDWSATVEVNGNTYYRDSAGLWTGAAGDINRGVSTTTGDILDALLEARSELDDALNDALAGEDISRAGWEIGAAELAADQKSEPRFKVGDLVQVNTLLLVEGHDPVKPGRLTALSRRPDGGFDCQVEGASEPYDSAWLVQVVEPRFKVGDLVTIEWEMSDPDGGKIVEVQTVRTGDGTVCGYAYNVEAKNKTFNVAEYLLTPGAVADHCTLSEDDQAELDAWTAGRPTLDECLAMVKDREARLAGPKKFRGLGDIPNEDLLTAGDHVRILSVNDEEDQHLVGEVVAVLFNYVSWVGRHSVRLDVYRSARDATGLNLCLGREQLELTYAGCTKGTATKLANEEDRMWAVQVGAKAVENATWEFSTYRSEDAVSDRVKDEETRVRVMEENMRASANCMLPVKRVLKPEFKIGDHVMIHWDRCHPMYNGVAHEPGEVVKVYEHDYPTLAAYDVKTADDIQPIPEDMLERHEPQFKAGDLVDVDWSALDPALTAVPGVVAWVGKAAAGTPFCYRIKCAGYTRMSIESCMTLVSGAYPFVVGDKVCWIDSCPDHILGDVGTVLSTDVNTCNVRFDCNGEATVDKCDLILHHAGV